MLAGKRIILGVTGGIAAYKAAFLLREFQKAGAEVRTILTPDATRFVGKETFSTLSGTEAAVDIFPETGSTDDWTRHINWGMWADIFVIAPCTANTLAKIAGGFSDNMLTAAVLAARCPILLCPTMDGEMYEAPAVTKNMHAVRAYGYHLLEPADGFLASGLTGKGRLPEFDDILHKTAEILSAGTRPLTGKKVLVTAGATREFIDPVRFISNPSSGKMGFAMAEAAKKSGADVTVIHGFVTAPIPEGTASEEIVNTEELFNAVSKHSNADIIIMAAAVSDFTPAASTSHKIKKDNGTDSIPLKRTQDILAWLGSRKNKDQILVGFAMETENLIENATKKLHAKNLDWIVANSISEKGSGFGTDTNKVEVIGHKERYTFQGSKKEVARKILETVYTAKK